MTRVLVTGAAGFVGSHLTERLVAGGDTVTAMDLRPPQQADNLGNVLGDIRYVQGNICQRADLAEAFSEDPDLVYHLASVVGVHHYVADPLSVVDTIVGGTRGVLEEARARGTRVVYTSTSEVFGKNTQVPWDEDADRVFGSSRVDRWSYGSAKSVAEHMVFGLIRQGLDASIVRFFNAYGPRQVPDFVISRSVWHVLRGEPPLLYDGGEQTRCFTFVKDIVDGLLEVGSRPQAVGLAFNLGRPVESTIRHVVDRIVELSGSDVEPEPFDTSDAYGSGYEDVPRRIPGVERARRLLDWEARTQLDHGLAQTIEWARHHPGWLADRG